MRMPICQIELNLIKNNWERLNVILLDNDKQKQMLKALLMCGDNVKVPMDDKTRIQCEQKLFVS